MEKLVTFDTPDTSAPRPNVYRANNYLGEFAKVSSAVFHEGSPGDFVYRCVYLVDQTSAGNIVIKKLRR